MTFNLFSIMLNLFLCIIASLVGALLTTASKITRRTITQQSTKAKLERAIFFPFLLIRSSSHFIHFDSKRWHLSLFSSSLLIDSHSPSELSDDDAAAIFHSSTAPFSQSSDWPSSSWNRDRESAAQPTHKSANKVPSCLTTHIVENVKVTLWQAKSN